MRKGLFLLVLVAALALVGTSAYAQNAQITGNVKDQSGGVLPGVTVTARNAERGFVRTALTDATGDYRLPALPPGNYIVTVELAGFNTETRPDIVLVIDQTATMRSRSPAAVTEMTMVTARRHCRHHRVGGGDQHSNK
jgi:hypothetical protein